MTELLIKLFVKKKGVIRRERYGILSGVCGAALGLLLFGVKLAAGLASGSLSVVGDALNNLTDCATSIAVAVGFWFSVRPASEKHPFGHGRVEYLVGLMMSFVIMLVGVQLIIEAAGRIITPVPARLPAWVAAALIASVLIKLWLYAFNLKLHRHINSQALKAAATDGLADALATSAVLISLAAERLWGVMTDGYMGVGVGLFILWSGFSAARAATREIVGKRPDAKLVSGIKSTVLSHEGIIGMHDLIVHDYGPGRRMVSLHAEVSRDIDITAAHEIIDHIELELKETYGCDATIHVDPIACDDPRIPKLTQKIAEILSAIHPGISMHDLRIRDASTHTTLIFDVALPYKLGLADEEIARAVRRAVAAMDGKYYAVIKLERPLS